jgi:hypothetical protein
MTEDEAKTKWCHQRPRFADPSDPSWKETCACIGSACMAWRETHVRRTFMVQAKGKHSEWEEWNWDPREHVSERYNTLPCKDGVIEPHGYCGLAGTP